MSSSPITPYKGGEPGGPRPSADVVQPLVGGGEIRLKPDAQVASKAAEEFAAAHPIFAEAVQGKRGMNNLDDASARRLAELRQRMRMNRPKPATIINLHPFPLQLGSGDPFTRGIVVPACHPGMPYAHAHIRNWKHEKEQEEDGTFSYDVIRPIQVAGEFLRVFSNADIYGGGIIIYEGETTPDRTGEVEMYDMTGRLMTKKEAGIDYDEEERQVQVMMDVPIKRSLGTLIEEGRKKRNAFYMARVKRADAEYHRPDGKGKANVNAIHAMMADVLVAEGLLGKAPVWNLKSAVEMGLADDKCAGCGALPAADSYKCATCGHILLPLQAFMEGGIQYGHASLETLEAEDMELLEIEQARRVKVKKDAKARAKAAVKDAGDTEPTE